MAVPLTRSSLVLMRRKIQSLGCRERAQIRRTLHATNPITISAWAMSPRAATWLLWAMSWRGVGTARQMALATAARTNAHRSMVGQYAGVAVFWSCRSFTPGPRRLCRPFVPVLARRRRAYARLGFVCAGSATGQNQVHTRDGRVCGGLNWRWRRLWLVMITFAYANPEIYR
jgi:hypothetical protein